SRVSAYSNRSQHLFSGTYDSRHFSGLVFARRTSNRRRSSSVMFEVHSPTVAVPPESIRIVPIPRPVRPPLVTSSSFHGRCTPVAGGGVVGVEQEATSTARSSHLRESIQAFSML